MSCVIVILHIRRLLLAFPLTSPPFFNLYILPFFLFFFTPNFTFTFFSSSPADIARNLTTEVKGSSVFLFGAADVEGRGLVSRRKAVGWFKAPVDYSALKQDLGDPPSARYGLTGNWRVIRLWYGLKG